MSSQKLRESREKFNDKVRSNNKRYVSRSSSNDNLKNRLPWGVDSSRLTNYVMETLVKMQRLRKQGKEDSINRSTHSSQDAVKKAVKKSKSRTMKMEELTPDRRAYKGSSSSKNIHSHVHKFNNTTHLRSCTDQTVAKTVKKMNETHKKVAIAPVVLSQQLQRAMSGEFV